MPENPFSRLKHHLIVPFISLTATPLNPNMTDNNNSEDPTENGKEMVENENDEEETMDNGGEMTENDWRTMELSPYVEESQKISDIPLESIEQNIFGQNHHILQDSEFNTPKPDLMVGDQSELSTSDKDLENGYVQHDLFSIDLTEHFTTDKVFENREELIKWAGRTGKEVGCIVVIKKSDHSVSGRTPRLFLGCERGGKYRTHKKTVEDQDEKKRRKRKSGTKKCDCPFVLRGIHLTGTGDKWKVNVDCGRHNHPLATYIDGHTYGGRLTPEEEKVLLIKLGFTLLSQSLSLGALVLHSLVQ